MHVVEQVKKHGLKAPAALDYVRLESRVAGASTYEDFGCEENAVSVHEVFQMYEKMGFLYPQKRQLLGDRIPLIELNWSRAMAQGLLHIVTFKGSDGDIQASVMGWRTTGRGWLYQHLVANRNPLAAWSVMQSVATITPLKDSNRTSHQNWFRPNNKYANRLFGSVVETIGDKNSAVVPYAYLKASRNASSYEPISCEILHGVRSDLASEFQKFIARHRGAVFAEAEDITNEDWRLSKVNADYQSSGLSRNRHIVLALDKENGEIVGAGLAYRGPLGLNFSFIENRLDLITEADLNGKKRADVNRSLLDAALRYYSDFELDWIPTVANHASLDDFANTSTYLRDYNMSIWMHEGLSEYVGHLDGFYEKVLKVRAFSQEHDVAK